MDTEKVISTLRQFLPEHEVTYCDVEENEILGLKFKNAGVAVTLHDGLEVFGSSSSQAGSPLIFAAYELLERYVVLTQSTDNKTHESDKFKYSVSNGVALHDTFVKAKDNAYFEMYERNEILKSWYYNTPIKRLPNSLLGEMSTEMVNLYEFFVADFTDGHGAPVIGVFALPNMKEMNFICGFGSGQTIEEAVQKAKKEFVTRLGFLWGELPGDEIKIVNSPGFHQDFYMRHENLNNIREWLFGQKYPKKKSSSHQMKDVYYVNITPSGWESHFSVVRARSVDAIPLFFGYPPKQIFDFPYRCDIPHPIM